MKKTGIALIIAVFAMGIYSFNTPAKPEGKNGIHWMDWKEMQEAQKKQPRKVVVDVYTSWCGWCKRMDASTFTNSEIIKYVNENYYAVKFDAEDRNVINFNGKDYKYVTQGNSGYNELAAQILNGQMSYPTSVYFDEKFTEIAAVPGYQDPKGFEKLLNFFGSNTYKTTAFEQFEQTFNGKVK
jgi:thioredoxin-related protein